MPTFPIVVVRQSDREPLYIQVRAKLELGRDCDGVLLADPLVSRRHVAISEDGGRVVVEDLGSTNGTFLDGTRLESPTILRAGSFLRFGSTTVELAESPLPDMSAPPQRPATMVGGVGSADLVRPGGPGLSRETSIDAVAREVSGHHGQITGLKQHGGTLTIVFSDIESSTEAAVAMGDAAWISVLGAHTAIVRKSLKRWGGTEVKNQGDGFMLSFTGARQALCCMTEVQKELAKQAEESPERSVRIRVGVHTGEVMVDEGDIFGKHVIVAARVANLASGGEILASSLVHEITSSRGDLEFGEPRRVALKGIEGEWTVYPLLWEVFAPSP